MAQHQFAAQLGSFDIKGSLNENGQLVLVVDSLDGTEVLLMQGAAEPVAIDESGQMIFTTQAISLASR